MAKILKGPSCEVLIDYYVQTEDYRGNIRLVWSKWLILQSCLRSVATVLTSRPPLPGISRLLSNVEQMAMSEPLYT